MKYKIEYLSTFYADVLQVSGFLEEYPQKAARIFEKLDKSLCNLAKLPEMYPIYKDFPAFRFITVEDYIGFYMVNKHTGIVEVHRFIYARMDILEQLK